MNSPHRLGLTASVLRLILVFCAFYARSDSAGRLRGIKNAARRSGMRGSLLRRQVIRGDKTATGIGAARGASYAKTAAQGWACGIFSVAGLWWDTETMEFGTDRVELLRRRRTVRTDIKMARTGRAQIMRYPFRWVVRGDTETVKPGVSMRCLLRQWDGRRDMAGSVRERRSSRRRAHYSRRMSI